MTATLLTVMIYDVADDGRRGRLHALLKQYGVAVQESAFEARLTERERQALLRRAVRLVDVSADRFVMYTITHQMERRIEVLGISRPEIGTPGFYVV